MTKGLIGLAVVAIGLAIVGFTVNDQTDPVVLVLGGNHGIHVTDIVGSAVVAVGVALVWTRR